LSHRTVSAHLYRIFPKLGVTSRAALRDAPSRHAAQCAVQRVRETGIPAPPLRNDSGDTAGRGGQRGGAGRLPGPAGGAAGGFGVFGAPAACLAPGGDALQDGGLGGEVGGGLGGARRGAGGVDGIQAFAAWVRASQMAPRTARSAEGTGVPGREVAGAGFEPT
jgi:hypothetical protein